MGMFNSRSKNAYKKDKTKHKKMPVFAARNLASLKIEFRR